MVDLHSRPVTPCTDTLSPPMASDSTQPQQLREDPPEAVSHRLTVPQPKVAIKGRCLGLNKTRPQSQL